jgi:multidrug efflux pump subunit AcrA (membrane-fusion protein)
MGNRVLIKRIGITILVIILALIIFMVAKSIIQGSKKSEEAIFNVDSYKLEKAIVPHYLSVQAVVEGDPQVKAYPQVSGKFSSNAVMEGTRVNKDDIIVYIDRDMVGYQYELAPVKAPISGIVTKLYNIDKGDSVNPQMPVAEVANEDAIKVVFNLGQDDLLKVKKGQAVKIIYINDPSLAVNGTVYSVPPVIDSDIMAGTVIVKAQNPGRRMKIGMSVNIEVLTMEKPSLMVPEKAILLGEEGAYVYINRGGKAAKAKVISGYRQNDLIEIEGDVNAGDEIITDGNFKLFDGAKLKVVDSSDKSSPDNVTAAAKSEK